MSQVAQPDLICTRCEAAGSGRAVRGRRKLRPLAVLESGAPERYVAFGSFGMTKPPATTVGVMRTVTPHSSQGCRPTLHRYGEPTGWRKRYYKDGSSPSRNPSSSRTAIDGYCGVYHRARIRAPRWLYPSGSTNQSVVVGVRANPEPEIAAVDVNGERAIAQADPDGP